jgi:uncharacterized protein with NAD-binding domain and iron-sulfur cluster
MGNKRRIAILGGGLGACSAAYWLTNHEGWQEQYEITLYQIGFRLGGKGASGRNMTPGYGKRIEEHGLHIWFGFYENGFRTMRDAFEKLAQLDPKPVSTFGSVEQAFTPQSLVTLQENWNGEWVQWPLLFPMNGDTPGTGGALDPWDMVVDLIGWMREAIDSFFAQHPQHDPATLHTQAQTQLKALAPWAREILDTSRRLSERTEETLLHQVERLARNLGTIDSEKRPEQHSLLADMLRLFLDGLWLVMRDHLDDTLVRRAWIAADLGGSAVIGILREQLLTRGFEAADDRDIQEWLRIQGAKDVTVTSAPVNVIYDLVFGFERGDTDTPNFAAGTWLRGVLRLLFTYKGAFMFKMMAGMGDTIFTPMYGLLRERGVKFELFHKVDALELSPDQNLVEKVHMTRQVELTKEAREKGYWPLVRVNELDCWPDQPNWEQIENASELQSDPYNPGHPYDLESYYSAWQGVGTRTLELGVDFDQIVLGIPVDALRFIAPELSLANERFASMTREVKTVQTQGIQLWLSRTTRELGWKIPPWASDPSMGLDALLGAYAQPLDTWADMSHLLPEEAWPVTDAPKSVAYFCGPLEDAKERPPFRDHGYPVRARAAAQQAGLTWFEQNLSTLWPEGASPEHPKGLDPALLIDPRGASGMARYASQWWRVNVDPSERYTLSVKGSTRHRLRVDQSGFENVVLAGDWTYNSVLNAGCVEATVASGMEASRAICGHPEHIIGGSDE